EHVAVEIDGEGEGFVEPRGVAAVECVERDPVRTLDEDVDAVNDKAELAGAVVFEDFRVAQLDGAKAEAAAPAGDGRLVLAERREFDVIEAGLAVALRPPGINAAHGFTEFAVETE